MHCCWLPIGRTRHLNLQEVLPVGADRARISGINASEFPEPTALKAANFVGQQARTKDRKIEQNPLKLEQWIFGFGLR
jgi:hypothetical protein